MRVVHADDRLVVVDKPAGMLSVPGRTEPDCASLRVQALYPDALVVHRLDQATSGLLLFARGLQAQRELSAACPRCARSARPSLRRPSSPRSSRR